MAVTLSVLRHDLLDIDRLLAASLSWLLATLGTAAGFALLLFAGVAVGLPSSPVTLVPAAILATLLVVPAHRQLEAVLRRTLDREGAQRQAVLRDFADAVRDGTGRDPSARVGGGGAAQLPRGPVPAQAAAPPVGCGARRPRGPACGGAVRRHRADPALGGSGRGTGPAGRHASSASPVRTSRRCGSRSR